MKLTSLRKARSTHLFTGKITNAVNCSESFHSDKCHLSSVRISVISQLFESIGLTKTEDTTDELKAHKITNNANGLRKLMSVIEETMNPFSPNVSKDELFIISTGKATTKEASRFLLNVKKLGSDARKKFIRECNEDPARFEKPITRSKLRTFQTATKQFKVRGKNEKTATVTMMRDLFGSILFLSLQKKVDMAEVFCYPLTPVPLSLCHIDGTMLKSSKVKLLQELESCIVSTPPSPFDAAFVDGMFFLYLLVDPPKTIGQTAIVILNKVFGEFQL